MKLTIYKSLVLILAGLVVTGCMVGPKYQRPDTVADTNDGFYHAAHHNQDVNSLAGIDNWWQHFGDPTTAELVRRTLENNHDLKAAAARVLQAKAIFAENAGRRLPDVSYALTRDRSKRSLNLGSFAGGGRFSVMSTTWEQAFSVSYALDLFGKLKRSQRAAWADLLAAHENQQALINSLIASVIKARIDIATLQRRLQIARQNIESRQKTLQIVERRYNQGLVGPVDVRLSRENLAASKTLEPVIELSLITAQHALEVLLARRPGSSDTLPQTLPDLPDLQPIPIGLPAALLDRRPDVKAAEYNLMAQNERVGVSIAQLFPNLTLTARWGQSADAWSDLWTGQTEIYSAIGNLTQPIFKGGQLRAQVDAAKARYQQAVHTYAGAILAALKEVEDALAGDQMLQEQLSYAKIRLHEAAAAENLSRQRYQRGVEKILTVLESERRSRIAENELIDLKGRLWTTRVNLFLALGGYWNPETKIEKNKGVSHD